MVARRMSANLRAAIGGLLFFATWIWLGVGDLGWLPLWPSILALAWVVLFRRVLLGLIGGAFAGAILLAGGNPWNAFVALFEVHLLPHFGSPWKTGALIFTLVLGGFAAVLEKSGAMRGWLGRLEARGSKRRIEASAMVFGLICFFDGLANSLMVGRLFRAVADRAGVARARLAYIVDTTSAAVACVSFISTWIAFQLDQIRSGLELAGALEGNDLYALFFGSIPFNFYCWFALVLLALSIWREWNPGPMASARPAPADPAAAAPDPSPEGPGEGAPVGLWRFFLPLVVLVGAVLLGILWDGMHRLGEAGAGLPFWELVAAAFGAAQAAVVMVWASVLGSIAAVLCFPLKAGGPGRGLEVFEEGVLALFKPAMILVGAWMLSSVLGALDAGSVLAGLLENRLPFALLPAVVFLVAAATSFTTGTSWGTMGLLVPLTVPLAFSLGAGHPAEAVHQALLGVIAAVFSGAVFGDHASPLSDTTIVSSIACGIEPHEHVRTQMPFALLAAAVALLAGFLPLSLVPWPGALLLGGASVLGGAVFLASRRRPAES